MKPASLTCLFALGLGCGASKAATTPSGTGGSRAVGLGDAGTGGGQGGNGGTGAVSEPGVTIIQEDQPGFDAVDGKVLPRQGSTSITGYTGPGFCDGDLGLDKTVSWSVNAATAGTFTLIWRYAFGGAPENLRDATLTVNGNGNGHGVAATDTVAFPYTNTWNDWRETAGVDVQLSAGSNFIQLRATYASGLANIDYLKILGFGITPRLAQFFAGRDPE